MFKIPIMRGCDKSNSRPFALIVWEVYSSISEKCLSLLCKGTYNNPFFLVMRIYFQLSLH